ncbi:MAG: hypothetical protein CVV64_05215 [Candidatus Wallbacteria bacterium HGW-Wallbacteria-1]|jgi:peptide/nickel transport system substrate-binding protein/oligopeptide transport system substrate-binding protein|uniref:Solute-binding protein family 5 domain-containing protein n=1 Tax=Candidatus Wallbacteria bacterium HGW-Wallbacteria-1 TaxID=2013854 RepID=A0A2N1PS59_9BACT|nr:MAG: hypothetical protein CVV64_05215 [Candidatus Wallbacteria bacterium HGW-Wallbacteria-1]
MKRKLICSLQENSEGIRGKRASRISIIIVLLLSMIIGSSLGGCSCSQSGKTGSRGPSSGAVTLCIPSDITGLDPAFCVDVDSGAIAALIHSGLVKFNDSGDLAGDLASSWTISPNGLDYTFQLDSSRSFSNGSPVTSEDVVHSLNRLADPSTGSSRGWMLQRVKGYDDLINGRSERLAGIRSEMPGKLTIILDKPFSPFLSMMATVNTYIIPKTWNKPKGQEIPPGAGPYTLTEWKRDDRLIFTPKSPSLNPVTIRIIPDPSTMVAEFRAGNLDLIKIPTSELSWFRKNRKNHTLSVPNLNVYYIGMNNRVEPFNRADIRQAANLAIDRKTIISTVLEGTGVISAGPVPPGLSTEMDTIEPLKHDPEKARKLLRESGLPLPVKMELWQKTGNKDREAVQAIKGYLDEVGFDVTIVQADWSTLLEAANNGKAPCFYMSWSADYPDPENFLFPLFHSSNWGSNGNRACFSSPQVDQLLQNAVSTTDRKVRLTLFSRAQKLIVERAPWIFLWHRTDFYCFSDRMKPITPPSIYNAEKGEGYKFQTDKFTGKERGTEKTLPADKEIEATPDKKEK